MRKYLIGLGAVLFPSLLLYPNGQGFARDWSNHVWMVGYYGEYFRQHLSFPVIANTHDVGGMAFPAFYGYLFYPCLGLASTHVHPEVVVRLAAVLMFAAQYVCVRKTMRRLKADEGVASAAACLAVWSVYAMTNLYNRSATTEFFAVGALTCAACAWFDLLAAPSGVAAWRRGLRFGLLLTLAIGFHPITGLCSLPLLALLLFALPGRVASLRRVALVCAATGAASAAVLSPWVFAVRAYQKDLLLGSDPVQASAFDRWQHRLNPLPSDTRCDAAAPEHVSSPYLESQIGLPLLVFAAAVSARLVLRQGGRAGLAAAAFCAPPLLYAGGVLYLSMDAEAFRLLPGVFNMVQFLYRLVSYVNLGFLLLPMFSLLWAARLRPAGAPRVSAPPMLLCFALTYAGFCVILKLQHAQVSRIPAATVAESWAERGRVYSTHCNHTRWLKNALDRDTLVHLPITSYGEAAYATPRYLAPLAGEDSPGLVMRAFVVESRGGHFGERQPMTVAMERPGYVGTNSCVFPWDRFEVDGRAVPAEELRVWGVVLTAVPVPAGAHTIRCLADPPPTWKILRCVSHATLIAWVACLAAPGAARLLRGRARAALSLPVIYRGTLAVQLPCARPVAAPAEVSTSKSA